MRAAKSIYLNFVYTCKHVSEYLYYKMLKEKRNESRRERKKCLQYEERKKNVCVCERLRERERVSEREREREQETNNDELTELCVLTTVKCFGLASIKCSCNYRN